MSLEYFALNSVALLLFLPGALVLHTFFRAKGKPFSMVDLLLAGSILWNFLFLVPSLILGLFTSFVLSYFSAFTVLSLGAVLIFLLFKAKDAMGGSISWKKVFPKSGLRGLEAFYLLLMWGFAVLLSMYTSIIQNIDAVLYYLPMAKAILQTGGLGYNSFYLSRIAMTYPPTLPLMYSFIMNLTQDVYVRLIPIIYFLLTNLAIFQLSSKLSGKDAGFVAVVAYSSMLATQMLVVVEGLSLDLGYVFYTIMALYALIRGLDGKGRFWYLIAGMSCGLAAVTKELGIVTLLLVFSTLLLYSKLRYRIAFFLVTSTLFFTGMQTLETYTIAVKSSILTTTLVPYLHGLFLLAVLFVLLWYLSKVNPIDACGVVRGSQLLPFLALSTLPCVFYFRNILSLGVFTPGFAPSLSTAIADAQVPQVWPSFLPPDLSSPLAIPFILHLEWYLIFFAAPVGGSYLIAGLTGLLGMARRFGKKPERYVQVLLIWFVTLLVMWSYLSSVLSWPSYEISFWPSYQYRRLYYFSPILSIMIAHGLRFLSQRLDMGRRFRLYFITFNTLAVAYVWTFRQSLESFILRWIFEAKLEDIVVFSSLFTLTLLLPSLVKDLGIWRRLSVKHFHHKASTLILTTLLFVNLVFPAYLIALGASRISRESWDPRHYQGLESYLPSLGREPWIEVIDYYNRHVQDDYVTVMFFSWVFAYFADRPVIDPYRIFSYEPLIPLLEIGDEETLLQRLMDMKVRYFLIPKPTVPEIYSHYEKFAEKYLLFRVITQNPAFREVEEFTFYYMYMLEEDVHT